MKSVDLFSGIGGITLALHDLGVRPVVYCEKDPVAQRVLRDLMKKKWLPKATVADDVRTLVAPKGIDLVMGGFPCQGFSDAGKRQGLKHEGSSLIKSVYRIVRGGQPKAVFLENVSEIINANNASDFQSILRAFHKLGYDGRYVRMHGWDVKCPQKRDRVYMLFHRRGVQLPALKPSASYKPFTWGREPAPRMTVTEIRGKQDRYRLLGNSVIPELTRMAFLVLWSGMTVPGPKLYTMRKIAFNSNGPAGPSPGNSAAIIRKGKVTYVAKPAMFPYKPPVITLDPSVFQAGAKNQVKNEPITTLVKKNGWSTIRTASHGSNTVLTYRSTKDIGTQIRFATTTPNNQRPGTPHPAFYEWLMGYRQGWTNL